MGLSWYRIKKWCKMLSGKSILHVNQDLGKHFSTTEIRGYYNNLKEKVTKMTLPPNEVPVMELESASGNGKKVVFSIAVFQYGLGAYDLYLETADREMLARMLTCADWAVENQHENGGWITFDFCQPDAPFSSMSTAEGISLLVRAHKETADSKYMDAAHKAYRFLILPREQGGVSELNDGKLYLYEYTDKPLVLNGSIFSFWGLWDYYMATHDPEVKVRIEMADNAIIELLPLCDTGYWSRYDCKSKIASPFYHRLHIAQLEAMLQLTGKPEYLVYLKKWQGYDAKKINKIRALIIKAFQKIME